MVGLPSYRDSVLLIGLTVKSPFCRGEDSYWHVSHSAADEVWKAYATDTGFCQILDSLCGPWDVAVTIPSLLPYLLGISNTFKEGEAIFRFSFYQD